MNTAAITPTPKNPTTPANQSVQTDQVGNVINLAELLTKREAIERYGLSKSRIEYLQRGKRTLPVTWVRNPRTGRLAMMYAPADIEAASKSFGETYYIAARGERKASFVASGKSSVPATFRVPYPATVRSPDKPSGLLSASEVMTRYNLNRNQLFHLRELGLLASTRALDRRTERISLRFVLADVEVAVAAYRSKQRITTPYKPRPGETPLSPVITESPDNSVPAILRAVHAGKTDSDCADGFFLVVRKAIREWRAAPKSEPIVLGERRVVEYLSGETRTGWEVIPCPLTGAKSRQLAETLDKLERNRRNA